MASTDSKDQYIEQLKQELVEEKNNLYLAGAFGKQLLQQNESLNKTLEKTTKDFTTKIEALEQEKYSLQLQLESKCTIEKNQNAEIENLMEAVEKLKTRNNTLEKLNAELSSKVQEVITQKTNLEESCLHLTNNEDALKKKVKLLEDNLEEMNNRINQTFSHDMTNDEFQNLQAEFQQSLTEKQALEKSLHEALEENSVLQKVKQKLEKLYQEKCEEASDKDREIASMSLSLEESQKDILELKAELENTLLQQRDVNSRGNSIFAEVEDHRKKLSRKFATLQTKYQVEKERNEYYCQQLQTARMQMTTLLSTMTTKVDKDYLRNIEDSLSHAREELRRTNILLTEAEKKVEDLKLHCKELESQMGNQSQQNSDYSKFQLKQSQDEITRLQKELQETRLEKIMESDLLIQCQRKLRLAEKNCMTHKAEVLRLLLKLEEQKGMNSSCNKPPTIKIKEKLPGFEEKDPETENTPSLETTCSKENCNSKNMNFSHQASEGTLNKGTKKVTLSLDTLVINSDGVQEKQTLHEEPKQPPVVMSRKSGHERGRKVTPCNELTNLDENECKQQ